MKGVAGIEQPPSRAVVQTLARANQARNPLVRPTLRLPPFKSLHLSFSISFHGRRLSIPIFAEYNVVIACLFYWSIGACRRQAAHTAYFIGLVAA